MKSSTTVAIVPPLHFVYFRSLHPISISHLRIPNVIMIPIADTCATWDLFVAWQRGKTSGPLRA
jgi:hypothetical protein